MLIFQLKVQHSTPKTCLNGLLYRLVDVFSDAGVTLIYISSTYSSHRDECPPTAVNQNITLATGSGKKLLEIIFLYAQLFLRIMF